MPGAVLRSWAVATVSSLRPTSAPCSDGGVAYVSRPAARQRIIVRESASAVSWNCQHALYRPRPARASPSVRAVSRRFGTSADHDHGDVVRCLHAAGEALNLLENPLRDPLPSLGREPLDDGPQSPLAEQLPASVACLGDAIGIEHHGIASFKTHRPVLKVDALEDSEDRAGRVEQLGAA